VVDIFSHGRMPILAVWRLHLIDPSSIEHNSACYIVCQTNLTDKNSMPYHSLKCSDLVIESSNFSYLTYICRPHEIAGNGKPQSGDHVALSAFYKVQFF